MCMEDLIIFRLFLAFPLIGLIIPDIGLFFSSLMKRHIPVTHIIIEGTLLICIFICTLGIRHYRYKAGTLTT
jgi:hypothetical protein